MFYFKLIVLLIIQLVCLCSNCRSSPARTNSHADGSIRINKCCEPNEILFDLRCADANETGQGDFSVEKRGIKI